MIWISLILALCITAIIPMKALAECSSVETINPQRCGMKCVLENKICDTKEEADSWAKHTEGRVFKPSGSDKWLVEYLVTELVANATMEE